jgi:putative component of toxin-antitoxin plasmid stabilization module
MDNTLPTAHILVQVLCGIVKSVKDENIQVSKEKAERLWLCMALYHCTWR